MKKLLTSQPIKGIMDIIKKWWTTTMLDHFDKLPLMFGVVFIVGFILGIIVS